MLDRAKYIIKAETEPRRVFSNILHITFACGRKIYDSPDVDSLTSNTKCDFIKSLKEIKGLHQPVIEFLNVENPY